MRLPLFLVAAIVLIVFAIIATAQTTGANVGQLFGVQWYSWLCASLLAYFTDLVFGFEFANGRLGRRGAPVE